MQPPTKWLTWLGLGDEAPDAPTTPWPPGDELGTLAAVGWAGPRDARLWARLPPREHWVHLTAGTCTQRARLPEARDPQGDHTLGVSLVDLGLTVRPDTAYELDVIGPGGWVTGCRFHSAPEGEGPGEVTLAFVSCHDPFESDGDLHPGSMAFLRALPEAFAAAGVRRVVWMGDQVYTDLPEALSLTDPDHFATVAPPGRERLQDCTRAEGREMVQARYRRFWGHEAFGALLSRFAVSLIPDDHEIVDNYGSLPEHATAPWRTVRDGALDAFYDYQGRGRFLRRPDRFGHVVRFGAVSVLVPDLRSERQLVDGQMDVLQQGWADLERWLAEAADQAVVVVVLSVPLVHVPDVLIHGVQAGTEGLDDIDDRWSAVAARPERDRMVELLRRHQARHPGQRVVLVGGDMHVGALFELRWLDDDLPAVPQLVSSALSNAQGPWLERLAEHPPPTAHDMGVEGHRARVELVGDRAEGRLNAGLLRTRRRGRHTEVRLQLLAADGDGGVEVSLDSGWR